MSNISWLILLAIIGGVAVTLQGQFMGLMDQQMGTRESVFITYVSGGILIGLAMLAAKGGNLKAIQQVPWYALSSGLLGLVIVGTIGYTIPRLGIAKAFTIIIATQFLMAAIIDHFGLMGATIRPMDLSRFGGMACLVCGVWLMVR